MITEADFDIESIKGLSWASFLLYPDEFYDKLQNQKILFLKFLNKIFIKLKEISPFFYGWL